MLLNGEIIICEKCKGIIIKNVTNKNNIRYICLNCGKQTSKNTVKTRKIKKGDINYYNNKSTTTDKLRLYNFLFENINSKNKFLNTKERDVSLKRWLDINNIIIENMKITVENVFDYCKSIKKDDIICKNPNCNNIMPFVALQKRYPNGRKYVCCEKCMNEYRSFLQKGEKNTCHRMTEHTKKESNNKISKKIKQKILDGSFTPNITNSWSKSMCKLNNGKKYRSTWDAFFQLVNSELKYEEIRIPYIINGEKHIYIVDFVDFNNKIIYEIKPDSEKYKEINKIKEKFALIWCNENNFSYELISNKWFEMNYNKYKQLIKNQPDEIKMFKNLKQFNEN
jgi:hypothetical protein